MKERLGLDLGVEFSPVSWYWYCLHLMLVIAPPISMNIVHVHEKTDMYVYI